MSTGQTSPSFAPFAAGYFPRTMGIDRERVRSLLTERKLSPRGLSLKVGDNPYLVRDILSTKSKNPRSDTVSKLADELGVAVSDILKEVDAPEAPLRVEGPELDLPIRYEVAAGGFLARDELPQEPYGFKRVQAIPPYESCTQWLERVVSDSMDRKIPPGALLHVVDAIEIRYQPHHGDVVIAERTQAQGAMVERTVKEVALGPDGPRLWPRSHNPRWQSAVDFRTDLSPGAQGVSVGIVGLVLRAYVDFVGPGR